MPVLGFKDLQIFFSGIKHDNRIWSQPIFFKTKILDADVWDKNDSIISKITDYVYYMSQ